MSMQHPRLIRLTVTMLALVCAGIASAQISDCPCGATKGRHQRLAVKNRSLPVPIHPKRAVEVGEIIDAWDIPPKNTKKTYPREDTVMTVHGYLRLIKIEKNDCDIHMEIAGTRGKNADCIIAEIPNTNEYCPIREKLFSMLKEKYNVAKVGKSKREFKSRMPEITLTGYPFCDTAHRRKNNPVNKKGSSHGSKFVATLWEIHPVVAVQVE
jgi:hypothetical protein